MSRSSSGARLRIPIGGSIVEPLEKTFRGLKFTTNDRTANEQEDQVNHDT